MKPAGLSVVATSYQMNLTNGIHFIRVEGLLLAHSRKILMAKNDDMHPMDKSKEDRKVHRIE